MITAGLDIGTRTAKAVILGPEGIVASEIGPIDDTIQKVGRSILKRAVKKAGVSRRKLAGSAATGYGAGNVKVAGIKYPAPLCLARAVNYLDDEVKTVIDIGGLITRVVQVGEKGNVTDYQENEKCASGSGRFMEMIADALKVPLEEIGPLSLTSGQPLHLSSQCVVFAESEIISHVNAGEELADVLAGLHRSIAARVTTQVRKLDFTPPVAIVGGVAKNAGVIHFLRQTLDVPLRALHHDPQIIAALGAAILARGEQFNKCG